MKWTSENIPRAMREHFFGSAENCYMRMKNERLASITKKSIISFFLVCNLFCISYVSVHDKKVPPKQNSGYLFGIFEIAGEYNNNNIGLIYMNLANNNEYVFKLQEGHGGVYAIEVPPGEYQLVPSVFYDFEMSFARRSPINKLLSNHPELEQKIRVEPGVAVYLGHFYGTQARYGQIMELTLDSYTFDFETDRNRFVIHYPPFNGIKMNPAYKIQGKTK
ncbi:hypothetical protein P3G55_07760 [Leptospira sp. 96542]|nr:hypothetical protein [Leptospira sp. 96542]